MEVFRIGALAQDPNLLQERGFDRQAAALAVSSPYQELADVVPFAARRTAAQVAGLLALLTPLFIPRRDLVFSTYFIRRDIGPLGPLASVDRSRDGACLLPLPVGPVDELGEILSRRLPAPAIDRHGLPGHIFRRR